MSIDRPLVESPPSAQATKLEAEPTPRVSGKHNRKRRTSRIQGEKTPPSGVRQNPARLAEDVSLADTTVVAAKVGSAVETAGTRDATTGATGDKNAATVKVVSGFLQLSLECALLYND